MSLRSFYQHFASKDELLLAVFEEAVGSFVDDLRRAVDEVADPLEKLRAYIIGFYAAADTANPAASAALSRYLLLLTQNDPVQLARILDPQLSLLSEIVEAGVAAGRLRSDVPAPALTLLLTQTMMSAIEMKALGAQLVGTDLAPEDVWAFCTGGAAAIPRGALRVRG